MHGPLLNWTEESDSSTSSATVQDKTEYLDFHCTAHIGRPYVPCLIELDNARACICTVKSKHILMKLVGMMCNKIWAEHVWWQLKNHLKQRITVVQDKICKDGDDHCHLLQLLPLLANTATIIGHCLDQLF